MSAFVTFCAVDNAHSIRGTDFKLVFPLHHRGKKVLVRNVATGADAWVLVADVQQAGRRPIFISIAEPDPDLFVSKLSRMLHRDSRMLQSLTFIENNLRKDWCAYATAMLRRTTMVGSLTLSAIPITSGGLALLANELELDRCMLAALNLKGCGLGPEAMRMLSRLISSPNSTLLILNVSQNCIGDEGARHLARAIEKEGCGLRVLRVQQCGIESEGSRALGEALSKSACSLHALDLSYNPIGKAGKEAIASAIANENCSLNALVLNECGCCQESELTFAEAVKKGKSLKRLITDASDPILGVLEEEGCALHTLELAVRWADMTMIGKLTHQIRKKCCVRTLEVKWMKIPLDEETEAHRSLDALVKDKNASVNSSATKKRGCPNADK